jgi:hypothetical protein
MADEPSLGADKTIILGTTAIKIVDEPPALPMHVDIYTEARCYRDTMYLSLASLVIDGASQSEARIVTRLRMSVETAVSIQTAISAALAAAQEAADAVKQNAN